MIRRTGGGTHGEQANPTVPAAQRGRQGGHPPAGPVGGEGGVGGLRGARREPDAVLHLAEAVLREWRRRLREGHQRRAAGAGAEGGRVAAAARAEGPGHREVTEEFVKTKKELG